MPFNGSGTFTRVYNWVSDRVNGILVTDTRMDAEMDGFATGLSTCLTKDGQTTATANLPMGGYKHTNVADASATTEYTTFKQIRANPFYFVDSGSADAYAIAPSPAYTAYAAGLTFDVKITNANTGASTLNVNGLGAKNIKMPDGSDIPAGGLAAGAVVQLLYDGTVFRAVGGTLSGISDGDKGDITVSSSGAIWTIDNNAITTAKIADSNVTTIKIADNNVTLAKLATQAGNSVLAEATGSTAVPTAVTLSTNQVLGRLSSNITGVSIGTSASNLVQLNGSAQLPAVDGSLLTGVNDVELVSTQDASAATEVSWTSLVSGYDYFLVVSGFYVASSSPRLAYSTGGSYTNSSNKGIYNNASATWVDSGSNPSFPDSANYFNASNCASAVIHLGNLGGSTYKGGLCTMGGSGSSGPELALCSVVLATTSAITAIQVSNGGSGSFTGKFSLYRRKLT